MDVGSPIWGHYWIIWILMDVGCGSKHVKCPGNIWSLLSNRGIYPPCSQIFKMEHGLWNLQKYVSYMTWPFLRVNPSFQSSPGKFLLYTQSISFIATFAASPCILLTSHPSWCRSWRVVEPYPSEKWWSSSIGMMTFPIYGNIQNVPNHQPNKICKQTLCQTSRRSKCYGMVSTPEHIWWLSWRSKFLNQKSQKCCSYH